MTIAGSTMSNQTSKYDDVCWKREMGAPPPVTTVSITDPPDGVRNGMNPDDPNPPYWTYDAETNDTHGLKFTNLAVVNCHHAGGSETIIDEITFEDLEIDIGGIGVVQFNMARAFSNPESMLYAGIEGETYPFDEQLCQQGLKLSLVDVIPGVCKVTLELSIVFRGAMNDFDPGGVPVAVIIWPQINWKWQKLDGVSTAKRVNGFRGSIRVTITNYMAHSHGGATPPAANVPNFFTDSNMGLYDPQRPGGAYQNFKAVTSGVPLGWAKLFDFALTNVQTEKEFVAVRLPIPGPVLDYRFRQYAWPVGSTTNIKVFKYPRQGAYDNLHLHAKMEALTSTTVDVHAPFCGHSCLHTHWRWSAVAGDGAPDELKSKYKGWSASYLGDDWRYVEPVSNSVLGHALTPPNQLVTIALCKHGTTRHSSTQIVDPTNPKALDPLKKIFHYQADIVRPDAGSNNIIWPHGLGWAFRYATPDESFNVRLMALQFFSSVGFGATQDETSDFFVDTVYPEVRYIGGDPADGDQIPQGTHSDIASTPVASALITMEDL